MPSQATRPPLVGMPAVWLRDNCPCPLCRDPASGQRLLHITDIPPDIAVAEVVSSGRTVSVLFHPDGHRAVFDRDWLARHGEPAPGRPPDPRTEDAKRLWSAAELGGEPPRGSWPRYLAEAGYRRACQPAILREGLLLPSDVPTEPGAVLAVAASLGYVRETNYGRLFGVRVENSPSNLAFTSLPIPPHTNRDATTELSATRPLISLDACGRIREIRINPRSLQPVRLAGPRAGFSQGGRRHLPGCYADLDGVESAVAVGERAATGVTRRKDRT